MRALAPGGRVGVGDGVSVGVDVLVGSGVGLAGTVTACAINPRGTLLTRSVTHCEIQASVPFSSSIKYQANLENARSVFLFDCSNPDCVGGDFDLSSHLANAYLYRLETANGEVRCQGWRNHTTVGSHRCDSVLRFRLNLEYGSKEAEDNAAL